MLNLVSDLEKVEHHAIQPAVTQRLHEHFSDRSILLVHDDDFVVGPWAAATGSVTVEHPTHGVVVRQVHGKKGDVGLTLWAGHERFNFKGARFDVLTLRVPDGFSRYSRWSWLVSTSEAVSQELYAEVVSWNRAVHGEVLVFSAGCFSKSETLQEAIAATRLDDLVLPAGMAEKLRDDVAHFLASRDLYAQLGVTWKRGVLFLGPPGNGKTHAIKAVVNESRLPCLYVKSFTGRDTDPADAVPAVFRRARELAPCVLVMEDLDALIDDTNRSFLLNELDGFAANHGILTLASSNHPERLDPSLLHRPSRFDRKYRFELPDAALRLEYLTRWARTLEGVDPLVVERAAMLTEGFTYAYLKEVGLSTRIQWLTEGKQRPVGGVLLDVVELLRQEISATPPAGAPDEQPDPEETSPGYGLRRRR